VVVLSYVFPTQTQALEDMVTAQRDVGSEVAAVRLRAAKRSDAL